MALPESPADEISKRKSEDKSLKLGYMDMMLRMHPFNADIARCSSAENAFFLYLQQQHMEVPLDLQFRHLQEHIPEIHRARIGRIWQKLLEMKRNFIEARQILEEHWDNAPESEDEEAHSIINSSPFRIAKDMKKAILAVISGDFHDEEPDRPMIPFEIWKRQDKTFRDNFFRSQKHYLVSMRIYYEMLIEKPLDGGQDGPRVISPESPLHFEIVKENRYLKLIDAAVQAVSVAKAAHHAQESGRLRKVERVPYVFHPVSVMENLIVDVIIHTIEEERLSYNPVEGATEAALHDVGEDTELSLVDLNDFFSRLADVYDSRIDPVIESGFGLSRDKVKTKMLNLVTKKKAHRRIMKVLRVLDVNTDINKLSQDEKKRAVDCLAHCRTFKQFPEFSDSKLDDFLFRLSSVESEDVQWHALLIKTEDRAHNTGTLNGLAPEYQRQHLRATVRRFIPWCMLDHNQEEFPLYNALPRLIDTALNEYRRLTAEFSSLVEPEDRENIILLEGWAREVKRFELPESVQRVFMEFSRARE